MRVTYFKHKPLDDSPDKSDAFASPTRVTIRKEITKQENNVILDLNLYIKSIDKEMIMVSIYRSIIDNNQS